MRLADSHSPIPMMEEDFPEVRWIHGDDLCNCTFQRIGHWTNPYIAETLEVRLCCIWEELYKQYPDYVRRMGGFWNQNTGEYESEPADWDNDEMDMPKALWHRQLARRKSMSLDDVRTNYRQRSGERPKKVAVRKERQYSPTQLARARDRDLRAAGWVD